MGISVGNLHYHYATKHSVILTLQEQFIQKSNEIATTLAHTPPSAVGIRSILTITFTLIYEYRFLFNERLWLSRNIPVIASMFAEMITQRRNEFSIQIEQLRKDDLIRTDLPKEQYEFLFEQIVILYNSWSSHSTLFCKNESQTEHLIQHYVALIMALWIPYFTPKGLGIFENFNL